MEGMQYWIASVSDENGLYASELVWGDFDREEAWRVLGDTCGVRDESRRLGIPARLDGPFAIPAAGPIPALHPDAERASGDLVDAAIAQYASDDIEIDDDAAVSHGDTGDWISAWVFVAHYDADEEPEDCETCAASIETRAAPCDECGHIDEEV